MNSIAIIIFNKYFFGIIRSNLGNRFEKQNYMNFEGNIKSTNECDKPMSFEEKRRLKRQIRNLSCIYY